MNLNTSAGLPIVATVVQPQDVIEASWDDAALLLSLDETVILSVYDQGHRTVVSAFHPTLGKFVATTSAVGSGSIAINQTIADSHRSLSSLLTRARTHAIEEARARGSLVPLRTAAANDAG